MNGHGKMNAARAMKPEPRTRAGTHCPAPDFRQARRSPEKYGTEWNPSVPFSAFTLVELMVVIVIIGVLASITLPALKGLGQANRSSAAHRQILDDVGLARL